MPDASDARTGRALMFCWVAGVIAALQLRFLPERHTIVFTALAAILLLWPNRTRWAAVFVIAGCYALWHTHAILDDRLGPERAGEIVHVPGTVEGLPENFDDHTRFHFRPDASAAGASLPRHMLVYWHRDRPQLESGQHWRLELQLKPPWAPVNFSGADRERWLFSQRIGAVATVKSGERIRAVGFDEAAAGAPERRSSYLTSLRSRLRLAIDETAAHERNQAVIAALAVADRSALAPADRQLLMSTGTSHLLAISGLHIGLAALLGTWAARFGLAVLGSRVPADLGVRISLVVGLGLATTYAGLAGWGVSTQRALVMSAVVMAAMALRRRVHPVQALLLAACGVLTADPLAVLGAGFWLSFIAVATLITLFAPRPGRRGALRTLLLAQAGIMLVLTPLSLAWFQLVSPIGMLANLVAIPTVSIAIVPLLLVGIGCFEILPGLTRLVFEMAAETAGVLLSVLQWLANLQGELPSWPAPGPIQVTLAVLGGFVLLLPRGLPWRWMGLFLLAPLFFPVNSRSGEGLVQLEVMDVGQGTAVLVTTANHSLLYDSGPGDGQGRDRVRSTLAPVLDRQTSEGPETIVISHADLDHAGGLASLAQRYPSARWLASLPEMHPGSGTVRSSRLPDTAERCVHGASWGWDGLTFTALHPSAGLPYLGNDSSCVISINGPGVSLLLAGDISSRVENRLVGEGIGNHAVLLVPHHGSESSSSERFLEQVRPSLAIAPAGKGNRFGFPRPAVVQRYRSRGTLFLSTSGCGALRVRIDPTGEAVIDSARQTRPALWRFAPSPDCPESLSVGLLR